MSVGSIGGGVPPQTSAVATSQAATKAPDGDGDHGVESGAGASAGAAASKSAPSTGATASTILSGKPTYA